MSPEDLNDWPADDLRIVVSESFTDDDGEQCICVYSRELDAMTFVDVSASKTLIQRGVVQVNTLSG